MDPSRETVEVRARYGETVKLQFTERCAATVKDPLSVTCREFGARSKKSKSFFHFTEKKTLLVYYFQK